MSADINPVGARLARELVDAVCQAYRVIVLRGQASLLQETAFLQLVGAK